MLSRRLLTVSVFLTVLSAYLYFFEDWRIMIWVMAIALITVMVAYVFQHQLNWWWYQRYPPGLPEEIQRMYTSVSLWYGGLSPEARNRFDTRAHLFVEAKEFIAQGFGKVAEEAKYVIAYYATLLTLGRKDFLFHKYSRVVFYLHPFLTPQFPDTVHTYEIEHEDGTLIFSLEQLMAGFMAPQKYYQTGLHAFAELYAQQYHLSGDSLVTWPDLEAIGGWSREHIAEFTGFTQEEIAPALIHHWFTHREALSRDLPHVVKPLEEWLQSSVVVDS